MADPLRTPPDILQTLKGGSCVLDAEWRFVAVNAAAAEHFGRTAEGLIGQDIWLQTGTPPEAPIYAQFHAAAAGHRPVHVEAESPVRPGRWLELHLCPRAGGGLDVYFDDVTERRRAEAALRKSERLLNAFFHSPGAMRGIVEVVADDDVRHIADNEVTAGFLGLTPDAMRGRLGSELNEPREILRTWVACCRESERTKQPVHFEYLDRRDNQETWLLAMFSRLGTTPDGHSSFSYIVADITERRRAETESARLAAAVREEKERLTSVISSISDEVWFCDASKRFTLANAPALREFRIDPVSAPGVEELTQSLEVLRPDGSPRPLEEAPPLRALAGQAVRNQEEIIRSPASGEMRYREVSSSPVRDSAGRIIGSVSVVRDITARKHAEDELQRANLRLAEADHRKDEFIAMLSHELRNPLAPIRYAVPILRSERLSDPASRAITIIERQVNQLTRLVDDLLDLGRITSGKIELRREQVELRSVVTAAIEAATPAMAATPHTLAVAVADEPVWLHADPGRLAQVITNLLDNSAKFTPAGGRITLQAGRDGAQAVVRVRDTGVGIPAGELATVFDMFRQVRRAGGPQGGLGIGLALVKRLVDLHGGTVEGHSGGPGQGAEFVVRLPMAPEAAHERLPDDQGKALAPARKLRVLVVDDNLDLVELLALVVAGAGHDVHKAVDGPGAISAAIAYAPDVVLLDLGLPRMSGIEVAQELRRRPETANARLVALTGWGQVEDRRQTEEAGFDRHLTKPTDPMELQQLLAAFAAEPAS